MNGFRLVNANGIIQIDERYSNYELVAHGTTSVPLSPLYTEVFIPNSDVDSIIAIRSVDWCLTTRPANNRFSISRSSESNGPVSVEYFIFGKPLPNISGGIGLIIRNTKTGQVVYNSNKKYLRVLGFDKRSVAIGGVYSKSFPNKKIAVVQCVRPKGYTQEVITIPGTSQPVTILRIYSGCSRISGNSTINISNLLVAGGQSPGNQGSGSGDWPTSDYLFIDVTGY